MSRYEPCACGRLKAVGPWARCKECRWEEERRDARSAAIERLWSRVERLGPDECWVWSGVTNSAGYGQIRVAGVKNYTHRYVWEQANGPIPAGLVVMHSCDNPPCCNPAHLSLGTYSDNGMDMSRKGRGTRGRRFVDVCRNGHPYDAINERISPSGQRNCRACRSKQEKARWARRKAASAIAATLALFVIAATVAAHTAVSSCGGTLTLDRGSRTADITRTDTDPDQLVFDDVNGNGVYQVVPGTYRVRWSDGYVVSHLEVTQCPAPSPSVAPSPTPTPVPTPSPSPSTTPSPTSSPTPTVTPNPSPTPSASSATTPRPTLPPTDLLPASPPIPPEAPLLLLAVLGGAFALGSRRYAR